MKKLFLPIGLLAALFCALLLPAAGIFISEHYGIKLLIGIIFLVSGFQTDTRRLKFNRRLLLLFCTAATISLLIGPILGILLSKISNLTPSLCVGLIIISSMPTTISSSIVITELSHGNSQLALFLTIGLNLLAIITIPFTLALFLQATGPIHVERIPLLLTMLFLVLLPFTLGKLLRKMLEKKTVSAYWNYINSWCVILVVYASLAMSGDAFARIQAKEYLKITILVCTVHLLLFGISALSGKLLRLATPDNKALCFVASQKTLAMALAVITGITINTSNAVIVCLMFHFLQLFADSFIAAWWQNKGQLTT